MSKNVIKRDLVVRISNETGLVQQQVLDVVQKTLDYISSAVARGETVELRNFGVFEVKLRKARVGRNPNAPQTDVPIPPRAVVKFKPGKEMREAVMDNSEAINDQGENGTVVPMPTERPAPLANDIYRDRSVASDLRVTA
jgi:nucleoid DNA-binding protein